MTDYYYILLNLYPRFLLAIWPKVKLYLLRKYFQLNLKTQEPEPSFSLCTELINECLSSLTEDGFMVSWYLTIYELQISSSV